MATPVNVITLSEDGSPPEWQQIFPEGNFKHPRGTLRFNEAFHNAIVNGVNSHVRTIDPVVDTDHDRGAANAWVKEARYVPGHGTDVRLSWTPLGTQRVTDELYKHVSPEFGPYEDETTGEKHPIVLNAVSLTNVPFLKKLPGLGAIALSELMSLGAFELSEGMTLADDESSEDADETGDTAKPPKRKKTATKTNKDPDHDGDDDSTESGDTDHDYVGPDGNRTPKKLNDAADNASDRTYQLKDVRAGLPDADYAGPDKSFPIENQNDAKDAWDLAGHAANPDDVRSNIRRIASRKGFSLPATADQHKDSSQMADETQTATQLAEMTKLNERLALVEANSSRIEAENKLLKFTLAEARVDAELRTLSEPRDVELTGDDGATKIVKSGGIAAAVLAEAKTLILENIALAEPIAKLLRLVQETGTVPLGEIGVTRLSEEHDPFRLNDDDPDGAKAVSRAKAAAKATYGREWVALSQDEQLDLMAMSDKRSLVPTR